MDGARIGAQGGRFGKLGCDGCGEGGCLRNLFVSGGRQRACAGEGPDRIDVEGNHRSRGHVRAERSRHESREFDALGAGRSCGFKSDGREVKLHAAQEAFDVGGRAGDDAMFASCVDAEFDGGRAAFECFHHLIGGDDRIGVGDNLTDIPREVGVIGGTRATDEGGDAGGAGGVRGPVGGPVERLHRHAMLGLGRDAGQGRAIQRLFGKGQPLRLFRAREFSRKGEFVRHESLNNGQRPQGIRLASRQEFATF